MKNGGPLPATNMSKLARILAVCAVANAAADTSIEILTKTGFVGCAEPRQTFDLTRMGLLT